VVGDFSSAIFATDLRSFDTSRGQASDLRKQSLTKFFAVREAC